jgi:hypothetical protein
MDTSEFKRIGIVLTFTQKHTDIYHYSLQHKYNDKALDVCGISYALCFSITCLTSHNLL